MILTLLFSCAALPVTAAPSGGVSYKNKQVTAYLYSKSEKKEMTCLFRDDLPTVPYVSAVDYLNQLYTVEFKSRKNADGTFTVSDVNGEMVVDIEHDTIHFDDFTTFVDSDARPILEDETAYYLKDEVEYEVIGEVNAIDLDLGAYGIDLTSFGTDPYLPLSVINDIFSGTYHAALYLDGALYFFDVMEDEPYYDDASLFADTKRDKVLVDYTYRELCFVMDHFYGCPSKAELAQLIGEKGFDQAITSYNATTAAAKDLLLSEDLIDYLYGLLYLDMYMDDGGHTVLSYGLQFGLEKSDAFYQAFLRSTYDLTGPITTIQKYITDQWAYMSQKDDLEELRDEWLDTLTEVKTWDDAAFYQSGTTGVFSFDEFKDAVVEPFKWSLDYAAEHGVENFVIDLSINGGGATAVVVYMLSVICDFSRLDILNTLTDNQYYFKETVDKNLDGEFDEKDNEVKYPFNFAALTSQFSFSAANLMPCLLQYNGFAVIGERSGGGTCAITMHCDPAGYLYALSDISKMTYPDGADVDLGAQPDCVLPGEGNDYKGFYDTEAMSAGIKAFYAAHPRPASPEEPSEPSEPASSEKPTEAPDNGEATDDEAAGSISGGFQRIVRVLSLIAVVFAALCIVIFVVVLVRSLRRKSRL